MKYSEKYNILILDATDNPVIDTNRTYIDASNNWKLISVARGFGYRFIPERCDIFENFYLHKILISSNYECHERHTSWRKIMKYFAFTNKIFTIKVEVIDHRYIITI